MAQEFEGDVALWFTLATARIDRIYRLRYELCQQIQQQTIEMDQQLSHSSQQFMMQLQALSLIFLLLVWRIYRLYQGERLQVKPIRHSHQF